MRMFMLVVLFRPLVIIDLFAQGAWYFSIVFNHPVLSSHDHSN